MASHRKPTPHPLAARTALTLVLACTAGATAFQHSADAQPQPPNPPKARLKAEVDRLHRDAERATEAYNGAAEEARSARRRLESLRDEAARRQERLNRSRDALGSCAAAQYREGSGVDPGLRLALSSSPGDYLERAAAVERAGDRRAAAVKRAAGQARQLAQTRTEAQGVSAELERSAGSARRHKRTVQGKLRRAQRLLDRLSPHERAAVLDEHAPAHARVRARQTHPSRAGANRDDGPAARPSAHPSAHAPAGRSALAVAFARSALGKPYVWGGTGPSGYDCSGLTQAAWKAAGVSLPRTTYSQIHAGKRVSRGELAPGDLVFFYDSVSHVGLYIGGGRMIHAPRPGTSVRVAPVGQMPFAGAVRPA
ncbi:C40 family peptidase [Streptomyces oryzae]|uniref:C40 family peptidase n=1 Tax=Streptomyces oryzae TaxID=1434886 RepID=A0ABS3XIR9_9ACTN|nr:NlpC/P60 family protein [Streptomyces oryzae]MBO8195196.1 C40 family peptidase [Streptomyces oryzae]